jgi:hypothetical protein
MVKVKLLFEQQQEEAGRKSTARQAIKMEVDPSLAALASAAVFLASCGYSLVLARQKSAASLVSSSTTRLASKAHVLALRRKHFSSSLSVSYANENPLMIVKVGRSATKSGVVYVRTTGVVRRRSQG